MIKTELISDNAHKIVPSEKLTEVDFHRITPQVDAMIAKAGQIRLLIDASAFDGWEDSGAFETDALFYQEPPEERAATCCVDWAWLAALTRRYDAHVDAHVSTPGGASLRQAPRG
jgi:hypothetical protein